MVLLHFCVNKLFFETYYSPYILELCQNNIKDWSINNQQEMQEYQCFTYIFNFEVHWSRLHAHHKDHPQKACVFSAGIFKCLILYHV